MKKVRVGLVALLALLGGVSALAQRGLPPNPFLVRPARGVDDLIKQVEQEPVVMSRYCRHFQLSPEALIEMLRGLKMGRLAEDKSYEVFNVPAKTGEIRSRVLHLRKGERVLVDAAGNPVILLICGNPMTRIDTTDAGAISVEVTGLAAAKPFDFRAPADDVVRQITVNEPGMPIAPDVAFATPPNPGEGISVTSESEAPFLAPIAFLPTVLLGLNAGGGGGNPIPEPATMISLGAGVALLVARAKRRRR